MEDWVRGGLWVMLKEIKAVINKRETTRLKECLWEWAGKSVHRRRSKRSGKRE